MERSLEDLMFVALIGHGPNWVAGKSVYEQGRAIDDHLVAMRRRYEEGSLLLGGPFDRAGGIAVLQADNETMAQQIMDADPAVVAGVMVYEMFELTAYFDAFTGRGVDGDVAQLAAARQRSLSATQ
jgi:uncharacterized protein YciI